MRHCFWTKFENFSHSGLHSKMRICLYFLMKSLVSLIKSLVSLFFDNTKMNNYQCIKQENLLCTEIYYYITHFAVRA